MTSPSKLSVAHLSPPQESAGSSGEHTPTEAVNYKARGFNIFHREHDDEERKEENEVGALAGSWWGERGKEGSRPWHNPPKRRKTIPPDQSVAYERTKALVSKAARSVLVNARDVGHEALVLAADALELAPIMGLGEAARVLLSIWDSVEAVETNRMSCLRLTERCATILYSVHAEIGAAGPDVGDALADPVEKLTESFRRVQHFIQKQVSRPFLKRYLKRDEDARRIMACDASLTDSVGLFSVAIQIRMFKELQAQGHHAQTNAPPRPDEVLAAIATIRASQAANDAALDTADLYAAMRAALRMGSDVAMLDVLQINRGEMAEAIKTLQRALEDPRLSLGRSSPSRSITTTDALGLTGTPTPSTPSTTGSSAGYAWVPVQTWGATQTQPQTPATTPAAWDPEQDAAFHREFLESGLDALRRLSGTGGGESLPPWTITRWEVDREGIIGVGFFSDVYKGAWKGRQVAIKILAPTSPRKLFRHEATIWASLKHPHVLELLGASSATGDPPWFFVSPYMKNGTLVTFLKAVAAGEAGLGQRVYPGPLQMMHEVAVGMAYLHRKGVLHGDLKANNVLIDDDLRCVISDFGQSELKSEVYRLSQRPQPHGTLRWQAPEIISGDGVMTTAVDVYAFAIVCVEILTNGDLPWGVLLDDQTVQQLVLRNNKRPKIPLKPETSLALVSLIEQCWGTDPSTRPSFDVVARGLGHLEGGLRSSKISPSPRRKVLELIQEEEHRRSPDLAPIDLPVVSAHDAVGESPLSPGSPHSYHTAESSYQTPLSPSNIPVQRVVTPSSGEPSFEHPLLDEAIHEKASVRGSRTLSPTPSEVFTTTTPEGSSEADYEDVAWGGYESPRPRDERIAARRDERRYRLLLQHDFNPSLNLPLWDPSPVRVGAVGYLSKPTGSFVTLFDSYNPLSTGDGRAHGLPSIYGYGAVREATLRQDKRTVTQRGLDIIQGLLTFKKGAGEGTFKQSVSRRHSFPLRAGHKHAYLCTENTTYRYMIDMDAAKAWFKATIKEIVRLYGYEHNIQREDVFLVIGTLETRDYGLFVSHEHPDGQVHFNVYTDRREGQDWGSFSTDAGVDASMPGPDFNGDAPDSKPVHASRISRVRAGSDPDADAVLLARLRFKPDIDEPTRL